MHYWSVNIGFPSFYCVLFYSMRCLQMFNVEKTKVLVNRCLVIIRKTVLFVTLNFEEGMSCFCADFSLPFWAANLFCPISWPCRLRPCNGGWRTLPCGLWLCNFCSSFWPGIDACSLLLWSDGCSSWPFEDDSNPGDFVFKLGRLDPFLPAAIVLFLSAWAFFPRDRETINPWSVDDNVAGWPVNTLLFLAEFTGPASLVSTHQVYKYFVHYIHCKRKQVYFVEQNCVHTRFRDMKRGPTTPRMIFSRGLSISIIWEQTWVISVLSKCISLSFLLHMQQV